MAAKEETGMTSRERWTVYPLLFLTLGLVMRDRLEDQGRQTQRAPAAQVWAEELVTEELTIVNKQDQIRFVLTANGWEPFAPRNLIKTSNSPD